MGWWKNRRAYLDDFHKDVRGEWIYTGDTYTWKGDRRGPLTRMLAAAVVSFGVTVANGCIPNVGMTGRFWVVLPYILTLVGSFMALWGVGRLANAGKTVRQYEFKATVGSVPGRSLFAAVVSGLTFLAQVVNLFIPGFDGALPFALLFLVLQAVSCLASLWLRRMMLDLQWERPEEREG